MTEFLLGVFITLFIASVVWQIYVQRRKAFLAYVSLVAGRVAAGNLHARVQGLGKRAPEFARDINQMLDALEGQIEKLSQERNLLDHILDGMTTGVVYIGSSGQIEMMNQMAANMLRCKPNQWIGQKHWEVFRQYSLNAAIDQALLFGTPWQQELMLPDQMVDFRVICLEANTPSVYLHQTVYHVLVLCNDITQWHRLERMRSDFIGNVSHELKTPITAIQGFAETLSSEVEDEETRIAFLRVIYDESVRMGRLVEDLLTLSKLESQETALDFQSVELAPVVQRALDPLQEEARKRNLLLTIESAPQVSVWGDEGKLLQVFINLLMNAIHYTPEGGRISVSLEVFLDRVKVHVSDTGIGIPEEHIKRIFERFYRVDRDRSRASGGTGLGLAIVKHIVGAHGGEVGVDSQLGKGSDFWFTLPRYEGIMDKTLE